MNKIKIIIAILSLFFISFPIILIGLLFQNKAVIKNINNNILIKKQTGEIKNIKIYKFFEYFIFSIGVISALILNIICWTGVIHLLF